MVWKIIPLAAVRNLGQWLKDWPSLWIRQYDALDVRLEKSMPLEIIVEWTISRIFVPAKSVPAAAVRQKMGLNTLMDGVFYHEWAESVVRLNWLSYRFLVARPNWRDDTWLSWTHNLELLLRLCRMIHLGVISWEMFWKNNCEDW